MAIATLILFSLCVQMSEGATFSVVRFINKKALGTGVDAGGNVGEVVTVCSFFAFGVRLSEADEQAVARETEARLGGTVEVRRYFLAASSARRVLTGATGGGLPMGEPKRSRGRLVGL